eukprot:1006305-Pyramimonas_sp.AAC.1
MNSRSTTLEPTYYGHKGHSSCIDYLFMPDGMLDMAPRFSPLSGLGAELQAFKGVTPKDHVPIYMELHGMQAFMATESSSSLGKMRWNYDDLMKCLRTGHRTVEFLQAVEASLSE